MESLTRQPYAYGHNSPLNFADPMGMNWGPVPTSWDEVKEDAGSAVDYTLQGTTTLVNAADGATTVGLLQGMIRSGGNCYVRDVIYIECDGVGGNRSYTMGNVVSNSSEGRMKDGLWNHETNHSTQWGVLGPVFLPAYLADRWAEGDCNSFEREAGYHDGGYDNCLGQQAACSTAPTDASGGW